jgi:hypothetical protein
MGVIRTIIILVGIYYLSKFLFMYILPIFVRFFLLQKNPESLKREMKRNEGKVSVINGAKPDSTRRQDIEGEYVDYEEVK